MCSFGKPLLLEPAKYPVLFGIDDKVYRTLLSNPLIIAVYLTNSLLSINKIERNYKRSLSIIRSCQVKILFSLDRVKHVCI